MKKPHKTAEEIPEDQAERRFNETLGRLVNTPHKPHQAAGKEALTKAPEAKGKGRS